MYLYNHEFLTQSRKYLARRRVRYVIELSVPVNAQTLISTSEYQRSDHINHSCHCAQHACRTRYTCRAVCTKHNTTYDSCCRRALPTRSRLRSTPNATSTCAASASLCSAETNSRSTACYTTRACASRPRLRLRTATTRVRAR